MNREPSKPETITRLEIAKAVEMSESTVERREVEWGLDKCRSKASKGVVLYFRAKASEALLMRFIIYRPL